MRERSHMIDVKTLAPAKLLLMRVIKGASTGCCFVPG